MLLSLSLTIDSIISVLGIVVAIIIAIVGGVYAIVTNTKKYELTEAYRKEFLDYYTKTVEIMIRIIHSVEEDEFYKEEFSSQRIELLSELSALIEVGRFYFPNVIENDGFGDKKPSAYQGYRHAGLDFIVCFYKIAKEEKKEKTSKMMHQLERFFTSLVFDMIEPRKRIKEYTKNIRITIPEELSIDKYILDNPDNVETFLRL